MSAIRTALFAALTGDAALTRLLAPTRGGVPSVYHQVAPLSAPFPYVIFGKQDGRPSWTFRGPPMQGDLWMVKAVCSGGSATPAEDAAAEIDRVLTDAPLSIVGAELLYLRRQGDIDYLETAGADLYHHVGALYRLVTNPS